MTEEREDQIWCECSLDSFEALVTQLEGQYSVKILQMPLLCMSMVQAEDSVEFQPFYLGEALTTETEVQIEDKLGIGICLGDEPVRSYCIAVLDAIHQVSNSWPESILNFLKEQDVLLEKKTLEEHNHILRTKVDFKLMEQD